MLSTTSKSALSASMMSVSEAVSLAYWAQSRFRFRWHLINGLGIRLRPIKNDTFFFPFRILVHEAPKFNLFFGVKCPVLAFFNRNDIGTSVRRARTGNRRSNGQMEVIAPAKAARIGPGAEVVERRRGGQS